jgi:hypothetical protein
MTMRDPGAPRRNPFFLYDAEADAAEPGQGWRPTAPPEDDAGDRGPAPDGISALLALVDGLAGAQPEAAEHLVAAAHEVVLTIKVLVDATEAVLAEQRAAMAARPDES